MPVTQVSVNLIGHTWSVRSETRSGAAARKACGRSDESSGARAQQGSRARRAGVARIGRQIDGFRSWAAGALGIGSISQVASHLIPVADAATNLHSQLRLMTFPGCSPPARGRTRVRSRARVLAP
jgi:hypothetical protein